MPIAESKVDEAIKMIEEKATKEMINYCTDWCPIITELPAPFIAGGFIRDYVRSKRPSDMDVFFRNIESFDIAYEIMKSSKLYMEAFRTNNAITFEPVDESNRIVQLIRRVFTDPIHVLLTFDFIVCMGGLDLARQTFVYHENFMDDAKESRLILNDATRFRLATLSRLVKFVSRGYKISNNQLYIIAENTAKIGASRIKNYREEHCKPRLDGTSDFGETMYDDDEVVEEVQVPRIELPF
jgi:hypothetical protein